MAMSYTPRIPGYLSDGSELSSYEPTFRERATDWMRGLLYSDDREGQLKAEQLSNVLEFTPYGVATGIDDVREALGTGDYLTAGTMAAMAALPGPNPKNIRAYHGSPHNYPSERLVRFPDGKTEYLVGQPDVLPDVPQGAEVLQDFPLGRMRMDKIGTGEGAQAYGHGLYTAENEGVAKGYRDALAAKPFDTVNNAIKAAVAFSGDRLDAPKMRDWLVREGFPSESITPEIVDHSIRAARGHLDDGTVTSDALKAYRALDTALGGAKGSMYEVNIAADPNTFLDWDKPLSEQPEAVKKILRPKMGDSLEAQPGRDYLTGKQFYNYHYGNQPNVASEDLKKAGIPGIKYLDAGSRNQRTLINGAPAENRVDDIAAQYINTWGNRLGRIEIELKADKSVSKAERTDILERAKHLIDNGAKVTREPYGTHNYVVFDDNLINIIRKYGIAGLLGGGAALNAMTAEPQEQY